MMRKSLIILLTCLLVVLFLAAGTFAWLGLDQNTIITHISGRLVTEYFHCGSGTADDPFVITRPIHYYHMVEFFQRQTNLPVVIHSTENETVVKFGDEYLYFQIGCPEEQLYNPSLRPETNENTEYYVFKYDSYGILETEEVQGITRGQKSTNLNMAYYSGDLSIMPVGSSEIPFVGQLDGKGITVSNLSIVTSSTVDIHTYDSLGNVTGTTHNVERKTCDVGIFGYIGPSGVPNGESSTVNTVVKNVYFENVTIDLSGLDPSAITSVVSGQTHTNSETIHNSTTCYAGYIAGHLSLSSLVQDVYVNNATIIGGNAATIGFGYFGCVEQLDGSPVTTLGSEVATLRASGDDAGFGGSIDMHNLFQRLQAIFNESSRGRYVTAETIIVDEVNQSSTILEGSQTTQQVGNYTGSSVNYQYISYPQGGSFNFPSDNDTDESGSGNRYECLYGKSTVYTKTVTTYTLLKDSEHSDQYQKADGILIFDAVNYLKKQSANVVENGTEGTANVWVFENGHLYTQDVTYTDSNGNRYVLTSASKYYLNASTNGSLSLSTTSGTATEWTYNESEGTLSCTISGRTWYLIYDNGWRVNPFGASFSVLNGSSYLGQNSAANLNGSSANYAHWVLEDGKLTTYINGVFYYLNASAGNLSLQANATTTTWVNTNGVFTYTDGSDRTWYLVYNNGWCCVPFENGFTIANGTDYLGYNGSAVANVAVGNALHFSLENGKLITYYNNTLYYLNASEGALSLSTSESSITWVKGADTLSYTDGNSRTWYLDYNNGWHCVPFTSGFSISNGTDYLGYNGSAITTVVSGNALHFSLENGKLVTFYNSTLYYLNASTNGTLSLSTNSATVTTWVKTEDANHQGNLYYVDSNNRTWYLSLLNGEWCGYPFDSAFALYNGTAYLGQSDSASLSGTAGNHAGWHFENGKLMTFINKTIYYLSSNESALSLETSSAAATDWTLSGNQVVSYTDTNSRIWYLAYNGEWCCVPFANGFTIANGSDYLGYNGSDFTSVASGNALHFSFDNGSIATYYNGSLYYLAATGDTLSLSTSDPGVVWAKGTDSLSYNDIYDTDWYLSYSNSIWKLFPSDAVYKIHSGTSYFGLNGLNLSLANEDDAALWAIDGSKLFTVYNGTIYYLVGSVDGSGALSLSSSSGNGSNWTYTLGGGQLSYSGNNETWYLYNRNSVWKVYPAATVYLISQNGRYLNATSATAVNSGSEENTSLWCIDSSRHIYTFYSGARRYLTSNGSAIFLSDNATTEWTQNGNNITDERGWYLVYDNGWKAYPSLSYVTITDGTNYLTGAGSIGNTTASATASYWFTDSGKLLTISGSAVYYLHASSSGLSITTDAAQGTVFTYDSANNRLSFTDGTTYYVIYNNSWTVDTSYVKGVYITTTAGNVTYYLNTDGNTVSTGTDPNTATSWTYNGSSGTASTKIGNTTYYLRAALETNNRRNSTNLTMTQTAGSATTFTMSNGNLTCSLSPGGNATTYRLALDNGTLKMVWTGHVYYTISSGSHYFGLNGTSVQDQGETNATLWDFSNTGNTTTQVYSLVNGTTNYYLRLNNNTIITNSATTVTYNNGQITDGAWTRPYYLNYNNGWARTRARIWGTPDTLTRSSVNFTAATVSLNSANYVTEEILGTITATNTVSPLNAVNNLTFTSVSGTVHVFADVSENITHSKVDGVENNTHTLSPVTENVSHSFGDVNENNAHTISSIAEKTTVSTASAALRYMTSTVSNSERSGNDTYFPIRVDRDSNGNFASGYAVSPKNTGYIVSGANLEQSSSTNSAQKKWGDIRVSGFEISNISSSYSTTGLSVSRISNGGNYLTLTKDGNGDYQITNTTNASSAVYWQYSNSKLFTQMGESTYYLTNSNNTLTLSTSAGVDWTYNNSRLSNNYYYIQYYNNSWTLRTNTQNLTFDLGTLQMNRIYTYDGSNHVLTAAQKTAAFNQAALQLAQSLVGSTRVFGLHFMDAQISMDHIIKADYVSIFNVPYYDYELPEDSIDFHVIERGTISFFAGEYFDDNDAFFSLHQVFRYKSTDEAVLSGEKRVGDIKMIKEIAEVYKSASQGDRVNYIYRFTDGTYSDSDGEYTGATSLESGYSSVFETSWITAPGGMTSNGTKIYYFEIPCNAGEYCLGSVSGKTGAYLIYLDIATNGGDTIASAISSEGNDVANSFTVEFRDEPDTMPHSVLMFSIDAPANAQDKFSVHVFFDNEANTSATASPHQNGLYTISIVNKSGEDLTLYVYLCDDDYNLATSFQYAYRIEYTNESQTGSYVTTAVGDVFQMMAGFLIPATGTATEVSYH